MKYELEGLVSLGKVCLHAQFLMIFPPGIEARFLNFWNQPWLSGDRSPCACVSGSRPTPASSSVQQQGCPGAAQPVPATEGVDMPVDWGDLVASLQVGERVLGFAL